MRVPGWRALGVSWAIVLLVLGGGAAGLAVLGPPSPAEPDAAQAPPAVPGADGIADSTPAPGAVPAAVPAGQLPGAPLPAPTGAAPENQAASPAPSMAVAAAPAPVMAAPAAPASGAPGTASGATAPAMSPPAAPGRAASAPASEASLAPAPAPPAPGAATPPPAPEPPPLASVAPVPRTTPRPITPPDAALQEAGRHGTLPRIGADGRTSIRTYGREFDRRDTRPRIGIVVADIALSASATDDAIRRLPPGVALALSPYAQRPAQAAERARERGMETLIAIPLEPTGYPLNDPGDRALLTSRGMAENLDQLDWSLARFQGYVGAIGVVAGMRGERFAALPEAMAAVQEALFRRGLLYVDPRPGAPSPARAWGRGVDVVLDEPARTRHEIDRRLAELEQLARERGSALGLAGAPTPVLVEAVAAWAAGLDQRGLVLAPVSALIRRPEGPGNDAPAIRPASAP
jgi:hypothetical protein